MEKAKEMLVNSFIDDKIYLVKGKKINNCGTLIEVVGNKQIDVTDEALACVFQCFIKKIENGKKKSYAISYGDKSDYVLCMMKKEKYYKLKKEIQK